MLLFSSNGGGCPRPFWVLGPVRLVGAPSWVSVELLWWLALVLPTGSWPSGLAE